MVCLDLIYFSIFIVMSPKIEWDTKFFSMGFPNTSHINPPPQPPNPIRNYPNLSNPIDQEQKKLDPWTLHLDLSNV